MIVSCGHAEQKERKKAGLITQITLGIYHYNEHIMIPIQLFPIDNE
jgi:hypothetical protein